MLLVVELSGRADDLLVLGQAGVPLARAAAEEPVEVVEAPAVRPPIERAGRTLLPVGRQVPLAEGRGAVAVVPKDARQRSAVPWQRRRIAREPARELADRAEADGVVVATGEQCRPRRRAQRRDVEPVVADPTLSDPGVVRRVDRSAEGARVAEPRVVDEDQQHVRGALRRHRVADEVPVRLRPIQGPVDHSLERLAADRQSASVEPTHTGLLVIDRGMDLRCSAMLISQASSGSATSV